MSKNIITVGLTCLLTTAAFTLSAGANTMKGSIGIKASIASACEVKNLNSIAFNFGSLSTISEKDTVINADDGSLLTVNCSAGTPYKFVAGGGRNDNNWKNYMDDGKKNKILYRLENKEGVEYTTNKEFSFEADGTDKPIELQVRIPKQSDVPAGDYTDTLPIQIIF